MQSIQTIPSIKRSTESFIGCLQRSHAQEMNLCCSRTVCLWSLANISGMCDTTMACPLSIGTIARTISSLPDTAKCAFGAHDCWYISSPG